MPEPITLLTQWSGENVAPVEPTQRQSEAKRLAAEFTAYALDTGLSGSDLAELELELGESLESYMAELMRAEDDPGSDEPPAAT